MRQYTRSAAILIAAAFAQGCRAPEPTLSADAIREHTSVLASDEFLGRGTGQRGGDLASQYVADRFAEIGLEPVAGSYFQRVPIIGTRPTRERVQLSFRGPRGSLTARYLDDFVLDPGDPLAEKVQGGAEIVFVGYGVDAPENGWDDFAGVDVSGKFLMILVNDPPATPEEPDLFGGRAMTYYGRWTYKYEEAARQGALGALIVHETGPAGYPWDVVRGGWSGEQFSLPPGPVSAAPAGMLGWVSLDVARRALALGGLDYDELKARAGQRGFVAVPTGITAHGSVESGVRRLETRNVVGLLPGSERPDEVVTLSSHYDHFGVGEAVDGDSIYNGAYDNASGTALLIEIAHAFTGSRPLPRSLLFIATAAEEQGLLGAAWYVQSPLFPLDHQVAEINMDEANLWGETDDVIVHGEERSELGAYVRARASEMDLTIVPDAEPEKGFFFRSDHFPFARAGVPSLFVEHGRRYRGQPDGYGARIQEEYTSQRYHRPSDEMRPEYVFDGAVQQGTLVYRIARDLAEGDGWPNWLEGQEFKGARDATRSARAGGT